MHHYSTVRSSQSLQTVDEMKAFATSQQSATALTSSATFPSLNAIYLGGLQSLHHLSSDTHGNARRPTPQSLSITHQQLTHDPDCSLAPWVFPLEKETLTRLVHTPYFRDLNLVRQSTYPRPSSHVYTFAEIPPYGLQESCPRRNAAKPR